MALDDPLLFISSALAPVVSLSACAILASNAQTQFSSLIDRLRALNEERRSLQGVPCTVAQALRLKSLEHQIPVFFWRAQALRSAMFMLFVGMTFILLTSFMIVTTATFQAPLLAVLSKWSFVLGLSCIFVAIMGMLKEVFLTFRVVHYELDIYDKEAARALEQKFKGY